MSAAELTDATLLVLTSRERSDGKAGVSNALIANDPHFVKLLNLELSQYVMLVRKAGRSGTLDVRLLLDNLAKLRRSDPQPQEQIGQTYVLSAVAERARHEELALASLRELADEAYLEPVEVPPQYDGFVSAWTDLSGNWIIVLCDPSFSQGGREELERALVQEAFLTTESLWHKVIARMCKYDVVRSQFTNTPWATRLKLSLDEPTQEATDGAKLISRAAIGEVSELDAAANYVNVALYAMEAVTANLNLVGQLPMHGVVRTLAAARRSAAERRIRRLERDRDLVMQLLSAARWRSEQDQKLALDQIQLFGLLITVFGLSLAVAQLWAASLSTEDEARSVMTFVRLLGPPLFFCGALAFMLWLTGGPLVNKFKELCRRVKATLRGLFRSTEGHADE